MDALTRDSHVRERSRNEALIRRCGRLGTWPFYESLLLDVLEAPKENLHAADAEAGASGLFNGLPRKTLFDSIRVNRNERVSSPLWADPSTSDVHRYARATLADVLHYLTDASTRLLHPVDSYIAMYAVIHEHWHIEDCSRDTANDGRSSAEADVSIAKVPTNRDKKSIGRHHRDFVFGS